MRNRIRDDVSKRVRERRESWSDILATIYLLTLRDRIGNFGAPERSGVPGLWGHSYVRTYNKWVGLSVDNRKKMEGGIATSYFVLHALTEFYRLSGNILAPSIAVDIFKFLSSRTTSTGTGIQTTSHRGTARIDTNLRHTCFAYLIARDLTPPPQEIENLDNIKRILRSCILEPRSEEKLLQIWLEDSWPVGAIASYIAARDGIFEELNIQQGSVLQESRIWSGVRVRLSEALGDLTSFGIGCFTRKALNEHFPHWHPIEGLRVLRMHSTLGCLSLIGTLMSPGHQRVGDIVSELREHLAKCNGIPQFTIDSPPSMAAASAMLGIVLGPWYEPKDNDVQFLDEIMSFMEVQWANAEAYQDYWSEFTAPLFVLGDVQRGLGSPLATYKRVSELVALSTRHELMRQSDRASRDSNLVDIFNRIVPTALGFEKAALPEI